MPRLFFTGAIGDIQRLQAPYPSECKVPNEGGKEKVWRWFASRYRDLMLKLNLRLQKNLKIKCQIWFEITKRLAKSPQMRQACDIVKKLSAQIRLASYIVKELSAQMCLAAPSLHYITDEECWDTGAIGVERAPNIQGRVPNIQKFQDQVGSGQLRA